MIGIDCGGAKVAIVDLDQKTVIELNAPADADRGNKLYWLREQLETYAEYLSGPVWVEAPIVAGARNLQSSLKIAQATGVVHSVFPDTYEVAVASWKKTVCGNGNLTKDQVAAWLKENHPDIYRLVHHSQDLIDAACIALYGEAVSERLEVFLAVEE